MRGRMNKSNKTPSSMESFVSIASGCASNSAIETWMRRAIEKFCEVNGITAPADGEKQA